MICLKKNHGQGPVMWLIKKTHSVPWDPMVESCPLTFTYTPCCVHAHMHMHTQRNRCKNKKVNKGWTEPLPKKCVMANKQMERHLTQSCSWNHPWRFLCIPLECVEEKQLTPTWDSQVPGGNAKQYIYFGKTAQKKSFVSKNKYKHVFTT